MDMTVHHGAPDARGPTDQPAPAAPAVGPAPAGDTRELDALADAPPLAFVQRIGDTFLHWSVIEVDARGVPGARRPRCLVFMRPDCIRRVWDYPADWRTLDPEALAELSWHR